MADPVLEWLEEIPQGLLEETLWECTIWLDPVTMVGINPTLLRQRLKRIREDSLR